jgi:hypothetical protein
MRCFSYDVACQDTPLEGSHPLIEELPLIVFCPRCEVQRVLESAHSLSCSECGAPTPEMIARIANLLFPKSDPVAGVGGPLLSLWKDPAQP